ncbi:MAG: hypothetical protein HYX28_04905 [Candidatus Koribacter versatilis]|uniref:SMP-30/Gluconolactonase/LRE-like region domain-containing protein n=1 Tax=Candidatus Korobacter versatilis TaxID=658062 RepID=A0A932A7F1_9BACT|nr:hypothetical protein [Candidatus Koribacter versatilis]
MKQWAWFLLLCAGIAVAQHASPAPSAKDTASRKRLEPVEVVETKDMASLVIGPFQCDTDGNLYVRRSDSSDRSAQSPIRKYSSKGDMLVKMSPADADLQYVAGPFFVGSEGDVYWAAWKPRTKDTFVLHFDKAGKFVSKTKLGADVYPDGPLAVFPSGEMIVAGLEGEADSLKPYTGIFDSSGTLMRRLSLADDQRIKDAVEAGDSAFVTTTGTGNLAVSFGQIVMGQDGNAYLSRRMLPTVIYAINPRGEVVRRMTVDSGDLFFAGMHENRGRLAILFRNFGDSESLVKIVDEQSGEETATYDLNKALGWGFVCYSPPRLTFLSTGPNHKATFTYMEPK